jgi:hypothetical protein
MNDNSLPMCITSVEVSKVTTDWLHCIHYLIVKLNQSNIFVERFEKRLDAVLAVPNQNNHILNDREAVVEAANPRRAVQSQRQSDQSVLDGSHHRCNERVL